MKKFVDLHSHCLFGIDDGSKSVSESLQMLSDSFEQGVKICVATPHCQLHHPQSLSEFLKRREESFKMLCGEMEKTGQKYPVLLKGAEVYLDHDISVIEDLNKLCIGSGNYMLVEFSREGISTKVFDWLYSLNVRGIIPIVAHVERYPDFERLISEMSDLNVRLQVNADIFLSFSGRRIFRKLIQLNKNYIISSDMHNNDERRSRMSDAYKKTSKLFPELKDRLFWENGYEIVKKEIIEMKGDGLIDEGEK